MAKTKVPGGYIDDGSITSSHLHSSHGITTNDIGEHTNNKYYTDARVDARLAASKSANLFTTGNIEIGSDTGKLRLGTGADLRLYHNGANSFIDNFTGDLVIQQGVDDADIILKTDWEDVGKKLLSKKSEWYSLPFQAQSDYKCHYVGLESERFNDVIWE